MIFNNDNKMVISSIDSEHLTETWGCLSKEVTVDSVTEIIDQAKKDGLFDDVLEFDVVQKAFEDLFVAVGNYRDGYRLGVYFGAFNTILVHSECPLKNVKWIVLHELIHMVCYHINHKCDDDEGNQIEEEAENAFYESLTSKLKKCIPSFSKIAEPTSVQFWMDTNLPEDCRSGLFYARGHANYLFWWLSLNMDCMLGWPVGTIAGYKIAPILQKMLEDDI